MFVMTILLHSNIFVTINVCTFNTGVLFQQKKKTSE